jgi:hypothetical protein
VLRQRLRKDMELRIHLENSVARQMLHKLKASNQALAENDLIARS